MNDCVMETAGYCLLRCQQQLSEELQKHFIPKPGVQIGDCMHRWVRIQILVWPWSHRKCTWLYTNCRRCSCCRLHCCSLQTTLFANTKCVSEGNARCFLEDHCGDKISVPCKAVEILPLTLAVQGFHPLCFSPPAVFYKAAYCLGLVWNCLYQTYRAFRGFQEGLGNYMDNENPQLG